MDKVFWILVSLLAAALRLINLGTRSLWLDEMTSLEVSQNNLSQLLHGAHFNFHTPPLYYLALHFWFMLVPRTEVGLRLFSVIFDLLGFALFARITTRRFGLKLGRWCALLYAISPFLIYYAQEGRMYSLLVFEVLLTLNFALNFLERGWLKRSELALLALTIVCGTFTHYYYLLFMVSLTLWLMREHKFSKKDSLPLIAAALPAAILFLLWLPKVLAIIHSGGQPFRTLTALTIPYTVFRFVAGYAVLLLQMENKQDVIATLKTWLPLLLFYGGVFAVPLLSGTRVLLREHRKVDPLVLLVGPMALASICNLVVPMLSERYLIITLPFFLIILAAGLERPASSVSSKILRATAVGLLLFGVWQHHLNPAFGNEDWRSAAAFIENQNCGGERVIVNPDFARSTLAFYLPDLGDEKDARTSKGMWLVERGGNPSILSDLLKEQYSLTSQWHSELGNGMAVYCLMKK